MEINRREFLKLLGVSGTGAAIGIWGAETIFSIPDDLFQRAISGPRLESWTNSVCSMCPGGCGISVRKIDGIPVRITGNKFSPINQGAVCPRAEAGINWLFHPDRLRQPIKRAGERGENRWIPVSWDEALNILSERLGLLQRERRNEQLVLVTDSQNTMLDDLSARFMQSFGSPNYFKLSDMDAFALPARLSQGLSQIPAYNLNNADYILNFGGDFLDEEPSPVRFNQIYVNLRTRANRDKTDIVHIGSYMSRTAVNSTRWIPVKPGTMAALALGIANVIIRDESFDHDFIKNNSFGFYEWKDQAGHQHKGFKDVVITDYYPEKVSEISGISAHTIVTIAREFAAAKNPVAIAGRQVAQSTNCLYSLWSIYCLNALSGKINQPGGIIFPDALSADFLFQPETKGNVIQGNENPGNGLTDHLGLSITLHTFEQILHAVDSIKNYPVDTIILRLSNPSSQFSPSERYAEILRKIPFIVSCTSFMNESAALADLILPESAFLENWEISRNIPYTEFSHFGVQQPVIEPLYDTLQFGDILLNIDKNLSNPGTKFFPWENYPDYLKAFAREIFNSGEGIIISEKVDVSWIQFLKERGFQLFGYSSFEEFWDLLIEHGGWWNPVIENRRNSLLFTNHSGKFEFYSLSLKQEIENYTHQLGSQIKSIEDVYEHLKINVRDDLVYLPHYEEPRFEPNKDQYPFHLLGYHINGSNHDNDPILGLLEEVGGVYFREFWNLWAEINPDTAQILGIEKDQLITVISRIGQISLKVKLMPTVMPDTIMVPMIRSKGVAKNGFHTISAGDFDYMSGTRSMISTMVRIEKNNNLLT